MKTINSREFFQEVQALPRVPEVIVIAGASCSGKTYLATKLSDLLGGCLICGDNWALPREVVMAIHGKADYESADSYDLAGIVDCLLDLLAKGTSSCPEYDYKMGSAVTKHRLSITMNQPIVLEFIHAFHPQILKCFATHSILRLLLVTPPLHRLLRRICRDTESRGKEFVEITYHWTNSAKAYQAQEIVLMSSADYIIKCELSFSEWAMISETMKSILLAQS